MARRIARRLTIYDGGNWVFGAVNSNALARQVDGSRYYRMAVTFGIINNEQTNPSVNLDTGVSGDYLVIDRNGILSIMKKKTYELKFTTNPRQESPKATSSRRLIDKDFYTENARNQPR